MEASAVSPNDEVRPVRSIIREFIKSVIDGEDEFNQDEIVDYAIKRFEGDDEFRRAATRDLVPVLVPEVLRQVVRDSKGDFVKSATGYIRNTKIEATTRERLAKVFESTGTGYRSFLTLKKRDLLALNERDQKEIDTRKQWVEFRSDLSTRMDDLRSVGDAFTGNELEGAWRKHFDSPLPPTSA